MRPADASRVLAERLMGRTDWPQQIVLPPDRWDQGWLSYLAVRHFLAPHGKALPEPWRQEFDGAGGTVWRNPEALPLFLFPARLRRLPGHAAALAATVTNQRLATDAVVGDGPASDAAASGAAASGAAASGAAADTALPRGEVRAIRPRPNGFDLDVSSPTGGVVASSVSFARGWRGTAGGRQARVVEVNSAFLGVQVPAGTHRVELRYRPLGWTAGWLLCGLAAAAWGAHGGWKTLRRR